MRKLKVFLKFIAAGLVAFIILSVMSSFYYLLPVHMENPKHNTDYVWPPNSRWIKMTEGISWGKMDSEGYNNPEVINNPDILILGSSHMEATNVMQDENACSVLQKLFNGKYKVYNKGISGHGYTRTFQYLPDNLELLDTPPKYVIIETSTLKLDNEDATSIINHTVPVKESKAHGIIGLLQKIPSIRLLYFQLQNGLSDLLFPTRELTRSNNRNNNSTATPEIDSAAYDQVFEYIENVANQYGTQVIIMYHPTAELQKDGTAQFEQPACLELFETGCKTHNIIFADMTQAFNRLYIAEHKLPHGFITGEISYGHLNADGHNAIANELYRVITKFEEEN